MESIRYAKLFSDAQIMRRASPGAVGFDVYAYHVLDRRTRENIGELPIDIAPKGTALIGTGIALAVPFPYDCAIRPRSGIANRNLIQLLNAPGTLDPDYRGEAGILLLNLADEEFTVRKGDRIAQMIFTKAAIPNFVEVEEASALPSTKRNTGGFGSTGISEIALGDEDYQEEQRKWDQYFMKAAKAASELSDCLRGAQKNAGGIYERDVEGRYCGSIRRFGCVIVKGHNIVAQGFNHRNMECSEKDGCIREKTGIASGKSNDDGCLHAEESAIQNFSRTGGVSLEGSTFYCNAEPCKKCAKFMAGCGPEAVVVPKGVYPTNGIFLLKDAGIEVRHV